MNRKIDIYTRRVERGRVALDYVASTNWVRTCREAELRAQSAFPGRGPFRAHFSRS